MFMVSKIKKIIAENKARQEEQIYQAKELEWAHIYHDSIRGKKWIEDLPLNIGRWAGNYSFFYVLNRILSDYKPKAILDLGLGESSKFISAYLENYLLDSKHTIVEQDEEWAKEFQLRVSLAKSSDIVYCPIKTREINGYKSNSYDGFDEKIKGKFDLYIIDGPFGSERYSRYDIISKIEELNSEDEFIILFDDTDRRGEKDTLKEIIRILKNKKVNIFIGNYVGNKTNTVLATNKYKFAISL